MWFRADLRVSDNAAIWHAAAEAAEEGGAVVACVVICSEQWREHDWAGIKVDFILRNLRELQDELAKLNIPLLIRSAPRFAECPALLAELAVEHGCRAIFFNREYEINERRRDEAVAAECKKLGISCRGFTDQTLTEPGDVRTANGTGGYFTVFTPFRNALYRVLQERGGVEVWPKVKKQAETGIVSGPIPERVEGFVSHVRDAETIWPAGEKHAQKRLNVFVDQRISDYKKCRDFPAMDATSALSPYLCVGAISVRQCVSAAKEANNGKLDGGKDGPACWISELAWREFYKHILVGFPRVSMGRAFKQETERLKWSYDQKHFDAWCTGKTGVPIVDAGMRQLAETGWMHNRVRMVVAMYLTKNLFIDWRWGEKFFMQHLIDGDHAANNGGWQWSASTGTDAAPYFRIFNPVSQSRTYDPDGEYIRRYVPELKHLEAGAKGALHDPSDLPPLARANLEYPEPLVDLSRSRERAIKAFQELR